MNIFLINYLLILAEAFLLLYQPKSTAGISEEQRKKRKKVFVWLVCIQWILISGLRANSVGADTSNYMRIFDDHRLWEWSKVFGNFKDYYLNNGSYEPSYILLEKIIGTFSDNHEVYKFIIAIIFMGSLGRFVYKNSDDPLLAFILYSGMFYNMFSLTGYRQVVSVAIGILWAYDYVKERRFWPFLVLVLIASTFHKSTLIFILYYFLYNKKVTALYAITAVAAILFMIANRYILFYYVKDFVGYDEYGGASGFTQRNFLFMAAALAMLAVWRYKFIIKENHDASRHYNALILSGMMIPFAMVSPTSMRLVYDFGFMLMILLPYIIESFKNKKDKFITYAAIILIFAYFVATKTPEYTFFWQ